MLKNSTSKTGHRRARPWGGWLRAAALTAGLAAASPAHAVVDAGATIPGEQSGSVKVTSLIRSATLRTTLNRQNWISYQDCIDDIELKFTIGVTSPSEANPLYAVVSNSSIDCKQISYRNDHSVCIPLEVTSKTLAAPLVIIKAKALTEKLGITNCGADLADAGVNSDGASIKFYFMSNPPSQDLTDNYAIYMDAGIDLWGPAAPSALKVISGDEELQIEFASQNGSDSTGFYFYSDDGTGVPDGGIPTTNSTSGGSSAATTGGSNTSAAATTGAGGSTSTSAGTATSAGAGGAGGASTSSTSTGVGGSGGAGGASTSSASSSTSSASGTSTSTGGMGGAGGVGGMASTGTMMSAGVTGSGNTDACSPTSAAPMCVAASYLLVPGQVPNYAKSGSLLTTGTKGSITGLKNGQGYVVGVAAYDEVGNVGQLSDLECGTPQPVDSILRVYKCKGGFTEAGCGFCSMSGDRGGSFAALVSAGLVVFGIAARRSRRPRARRLSLGAR